METKIQLSIGELSKRSDVGIETIRYYEKLGVLSPIGRKASGYRIYNLDSVRALRFVKQAQELGFTLQDIKGFFHLKADKKPRCEDVQVRAEKHLKNIEEKIGHLAKIRSVLTNLIHQCQKRKTDDRCPILDCFGEGPNI